MVLLTAAATLFACREERDLPDYEIGIHPAGFAEPDSPLFHGTQLEEQGYPLEKCRKCHGEDYEGYPPIVSCNKGGCHERTPEACDTCHGERGGPKPRTGAHFAHAVSCITCHPKRTDIRGPAHPNGFVEVSIGGLGAAHDAEPTWDSTTRECSDVYCHGGRTMVWEPVDGRLSCDTCHDAPPAWHAQFSSSDPADCVKCHGLDESHPSGEFSVVELTCSTCHGYGQDGAPPPALDGSMDPDDPGVGAHRRHLVASLPDRIGKVARCQDCHRVPADVYAEGHLDELPPADVRLASGDYDYDSQSCVNKCHFGRDPGPVWTDTSGDARACGACHDAAPTKTRNGTPHPLVTPDIAVCRTCHVFDPTTHVDGKVDFNL